MKKIDRAIVFKIVVVAAWVRVVAWVAVQYYN